MWAEKCRSIEDKLGFASSHCIRFLQFYFSAQLLHEMEWCLVCTCTTPRLSTMRRTMLGLVMIKTSESRGLMYLGPAEPLDREMRPPVL